MSWKSLTFSSNSVSPITPSWQIDGSVLNQSSNIKNNCNQNNIIFYLNLSLRWQGALSIHFWSSVTHSFAILPLKFENASTSLAILAFPYILKKQLFLDKWNDINKVVSPFSLVHCTTEASKWERTNSLKTNNCFFAEKTLHINDKRQIICKYYIIYLITILT